MLSDSMLAALNDQIQMEIQSAYVYLSMSAYFQEKNLPGFATWMEAQWQEELGHAKRLFEYVNDRNSRVVLQAIKAPPKDFGDAKGAFVKALEHEKAVTASINKMYDAALKEKDFATQNHLLWFVNEQVEEEKQVIDIINELDLAGDNTAAMLMLDRQLAGRGK
jgi:ferritin